MKNRVISFSLCILMVFLVACNKNQPTKDSPDSSTADFAWEQTEIELPLDPSKAVSPSLLGDTLYYLESNEDSTKAVLYSLNIGSGEISDSPVVIGEYDATVAAIFIALSNKTGIAVLLDDQMTTQICKIDLNTGEELVRYTYDKRDSPIIALANLSENEVGAIFQSGHGKHLLKPLNNDSLEPGNAILTIPDDFATLGLCHNGKMLGNVKDELSLLDLETHAVTPVLSWMQNDLNRDIVYILNYSDNAITLYESSSASSNPSAIIIKMKKVPAKDIKAKTIISFGCSGLDSITRSEIIKFNRTDPDYRIEVIDYLSDMENTPQNFEASLQRINLDIVSGNMPDIMMLGSGYPVESYLEKGLFADLSAFMEAEDEIALHPTVERLCRKDDVLFRITAGFGVSTMTGNADLVGEHPGWSLDEVKDILNKNEGCSLFMDSVDSRVAMYYFAHFDLNQFYDKATAEAQFESAEFKELLEFIANFTKSKAPSDFVMGQHMNDDNYLVVPVTFASFDRLAVYNWYYNNISYKGFPTHNLSGNPVILDTQLFLSSTCENKEGAWRFMRCFLTEDFQSNNVGRLLPSNNAYFNELLAEAMEAPAEDAPVKYRYVNYYEGYTYDDPNGVWTSNEPAPKSVTVYLDQDGNYLYEDRVYPLTREQVDKFNELLDSVDRSFETDDVIFKIVAEETAPYFEEDKTVDEVCELIQKRVETYLNEQKKYY